MADRALILAALDATGLSARQLAFAMGVNDRTMRRWLDNAQPLEGPTRLAFRALVRDPSLILAMD